MLNDPAPTVTEIVTDDIRDHRRYLDEHGDRFLSSFPITRTVGRFATVGSAVVEVAVHIGFEKRYKLAQRAEEHTVQVTASAQCHGHGCPEPRHTAPAPEQALLEADADETAAAAVPAVNAARAWAQQHAAACRAMPYQSRY